MTTSVKLYSLSYVERRTWWLAGLFMAGNILLPQLFHLLPMGGMRWLPIYLFTLIGAYKYGWKVGLLTAIASPIANSLLFGMPAFSALPIILVKSTLLAIMAALVAKRSGRATLWNLLAVVAGYQAIGLLVEWALVDSLAIAMQDLTIGFPGMVLQVVGGWAVLNYVLRK